MRRSSIPRSPDRSPFAPGAGVALPREGDGDRLQDGPRPARRRGRAFFGAVASDLERQYRGKPAPRKVAGFFLNPSMHACLLVRCCQFSPGWLHWLFRNILIWKHGIDVSPGVRIGSGLSLPHPVGIVIGSGCIVGDEVTLYQGVTLGTKDDGYPRIARGAIVYPGSVVVGPIEVGEGAVVGALTFVDKDVGVRGCARGR